MSKTLYDVLEVSQNASQETITGTYQRLHAKLSAGLDDAGGHDQDVLNQLTALREAYHTLSDPERRQRYDKRLNARLNEVQVVEERPRSFLKLLFIVGIIGACGVGYAKYQNEQEKARLERERIAAEAKMAELKAQQEAEAKAEAEKAERQRLRDEAMERYNRERDLARGEQVSRSLRYAETQAKRDQQREEQLRLNAERQQQYEAERQLAKEKAYLRQLESENSRYRRY